VAYQARQVAIHRQAMKLTKGAPVLTGQAVATMDDAREGAMTPDDFF
jgi:hypothetical protein